jgi:uncharacterized damage-inducible protein DinB
MEKSTLESTELALEATVITSKVLLKQWHGHRNVTRRVIEAFPEDKLFTYSVGGMRPFAELAMEMIRMGAPGIRGVVTGKWPTFEEVERDFQTPNTRSELLRLWDESTEEINTLWPQISPGRFQEEDAVFGQYKGTIYWSILYFIDNEIHHRGQGYVYLRSLGIEPPPFWDRG